MTYKIIVNLNELQYEYVGVVGYSFDNDLLKMHSNIDKLVVRFPKDAYIQIMEVKE